MAGSSKKPPKPMEMADSVAVVRQRPKKKPEKRPEPEPVTAVEAEAATQPELPAAQVKRIAAAALEPKVKDINARDAAVLINTKIEVLATALKNDYSSHHVTFKTGEEVDEALEKARLRLATRRAELVDRLKGFGGPNTVRVKNAWNDALVNLGTVYLQEDHWAAEPQNLVGEWRKVFSSNDKGEPVALKIARVSSFTLDPIEAAARIENELLPDGLEAIVGVVDWGEQDKLERELTTEEAATLREHRTAFADALSELPGPLRRYYIAIYNGALGALTTGEPAGVDAPPIALKSVAALQLKN